MEDSKNNDSMNYKKNNYILNCNFLNDYNSDHNLNRKYITTCKKDIDQKKKEQRQEELEKKEKIYNDYLNHF